MAVIMQLNDRPETLHFNELVHKWVKEKWVGKDEKDGSDEKVKKTGSTNSISPKRIPIPFQPSPSSCIFLSLINSAYSSFTDGSELSFILIPS